MTTATAVRDEREIRDELDAMTHRFIGECAGRVAPGSVIRTVARTVHGLRMGGVPSARLADLAEPVVWEQLRPSYHR